MIEMKADFFVMLSFKIKRINYQNSIFVISRTIYSSEADLGITVWQSGQVGL